MIFDVLSIFMLSCSPVNLFLCQPIFEKLKYLIDGTYLIFKYKTWTYSN